MRFLRRSAPTDGTASANATGEPTSPPPDASTSRTGPTAGTGKGRPTPKRREAEARRRGPVAPPPRTQREAVRRMRGTKEERRARRAERRAGMLAGDDRYLLPRDRGPIPAYVRDLVDSRRNLMGLFMPLALVVFVSLLVPNPAVQNMVSLITMAMFVMIIVETVFLTRYIHRKVRRKFPKVQFRPFQIALYAFTRATMPRRMRQPRPRVRYGEVPD